MIREWREMVAMETPDIYPKPDIDLPSFDS